MRRTKIICTIGPATSKVTTITSMIRAGMNVARLNFSHGTYSEHKKSIQIIKQVSKKIGIPVAILGDLQGPKIRLGTLPKSGVQLKKGELVVFSTTADSKEKKVLPIRQKDLEKRVKVGERLLIDDGLITTKIVKIGDGIITVKVQSGGKVSSNKGVNLPDSQLGVSALTDKDKEDVEYMVKNGVDWVALSFVTDPKDVLQLKKIIKKVAGKNDIVPRVMIKIERQEAVNRFQELLKVADGVMVARGDLGIEIPAEMVPIRQKEMIELSRSAGKPIVVATHLLDSMIRNPRPTRAEVSDVANAVFDHTDAVMLSGETAIGKYPVKAVRELDKIIVQAENSVFDDVVFAEDGPGADSSELSHAIKGLVNQGFIDLLVASVEDFESNERLLLSHPEISMHLFVPSEELLRQNLLRWGVVPVFKKIKKPDYVGQAMSYLKKNKLIKKGMKVAFMIKKNNKPEISIELIK